MKRGIRISLVLVIGVILAAAGVIGLLQGPGLVQYSFLPGEETVSTLLEELGTMQESLKDSFPVITLHAQKSGRSLTWLYTLWDRTGMRPIRCRWLPGGR